jgi:acetyl esterase/lipase
LALFSLFWSILPLFDPKPYLGPVGSTAARYLRLIAGTISLFTAIFGLLGAGLGLFTRTPLALAAGAIGAILSAWHIGRVTAPHDGFAAAFGLPKHQENASSLTPPSALRRWWWSWPASTQVRHEPDITYYTVPQTGQSLLCDLWRPPPQVTPSGLAFIYYHGGGWRTLDKDTLTRPFFRRLASQGHLVMDASYRLYPEVDMFEMLGDAKQALAWLKSQAQQYDVNPERIVVAGGSAGGHLALLVAYTARHPALTPADLQHLDGSVRAAVAYYPPVDISAYVRFKEYGPFTFGPLDIPSRRQVAARLIGGPPEELPERYALFSPTNHITPSCPPTLLLVAEDDDIVPVEPIKAFHQQLREAGVAAVLVQFPGTEHGFDLALPRYSPAARAAIYDVERFLALLV